MTIKAVGTNNVVFDELVIQRAPPPPQVYDIPWAQVDFPDRGLPDGDGNLSGQRWPFANDSRWKDPIELRYVRQPWAAQIRMR